MEEFEKIDVRRAMEDALEKMNFLYADIMLDRRKSLHVTKNRVEENVLAPETAGICLRAFNGEEWSYASTSSLEKKSIVELAGKVKPGRGRLNISSVEPWECDERFLAKEWGSIEERVELVREAFKRGKIGKEIVDVKVGLSSSLMERVILTSEGSDLRQVIPRTRFIFFPLAKRGMKMDYDYLVAGGIGGMEAANWSWEGIEKCAKSSIELLDAVEPMSGKIDAVIDGNVAGVFAHETFGHGTEADQVMRERSYLAPYLGKKIAGEEVTVVDSSVAERGWANFFFDDEGIKSRRTELISEGVFKTLLHDRVTSANLNAEPTANGRAESFKTKRFVRMTNTFFEPGSWNLDEMVEEIKEGMLIEKNMFGMEDPLGGGLQCTSKKGWIIENGELKQRVSRVALTGNVLDVFSKIDAVENRKGFQINAGSCGKGTEDFVSAGTGGVHLRIRGLTVSRG